jgi:hypothetical protein
MRYRIIHVRIWGDEKFRSLTPLQPSGQALFLYMLTNLNTTAIPGLYRSGAASMAEELGWSLEAFKGALNELQQLGLVKTDLNARVIFIPNAIKYNKPQSPNVIKSWSSHLEEIPECVLKNEALFWFKGFIDGMGEGFAKAFQDIFENSSDKAIGKPLRKTMPNQEQEQEQEKDISLVSFFTEEPNIQNDAINILFEHWRSVMKHPRSVLDKKRQKYISTALQLGYSIEDLKQAIEGCSSTPFNMGTNEQKKRYRCDFQRCRSY